METIAIDLLHSTMAGTVLGLLVGLASLIWLRVVERWLADGIDSTAAQEEWASPGRRDDPRRDSRPVSRSSGPDRCPTTNVSKLEAQATEPTTLREYPSAGRAARRAGQNGLDRVSLRWREGSGGNPLDPLSRYGLAYRPPRHSDDVESGD